VLSKGNLRSTTSVKLAQSIALDRMMIGDAQSRLLGLELHLVFCTTMMNVKYFEQFRKMLE